MQVLYTNRGLLQPVHSWQGFDGKVEVVTDVKDPKSVWPLSVIANLTESG
jgi:hypothetical protein